MSLCSGKAKPHSCLFTAALNTAAAEIPFPQFIPRVLITGGPGRPVNQVQNFLRRCFCEVCLRIFLYLFRILVFPIVWTFCIRKWTNRISRFGIGFVAAIIRAAIRHINFFGSIFPFGSHNSVGQFLRRLDNFIFKHVKIFIFRKGNRFWIVYIHTVQSPLLFAVQPVQLLNIRCGRKLKQNLVRLFF